MMSKAEFFAKWEARRQEHARLDSHVSADKLIAELLEDAREADAATADELLTLTAAGARCGYAPDSLGRLIRQGKLKNYGTRGQPRVRAAELPKAPAPRTRRVAEKRPSSPSSPASSVSDIARDALAGRIRTAQ